MYNLRKCIIIQSAMNYNLRSRYVFPLKSMAQRFSKEISHAVWSKFTAELNRLSGQHKAVVWKRLNCTQAHANSTAVLSELKK